MTDYRHINLHLPTSWDGCTTEELEHIAAAIVDEQAAVGRYTPFLWERVKLHIILSINELSILESDGNDEMFLVQRNDEEPWTISVGQIADLCERLNWLTDKNAPKVIFRFPYPELVIEGSNQPQTNNHESTTVIGPPPLLDGYTWREYRWLTDWMQEYMRISNAKRDALGAMQEFLAVLFRPKETSHPSPLTPHLFEGFSPVKWQVILFWWSSLMEQLSKKFPRVFKSQPVGKGKHPKRDTPWDFYNRVTATVQKYIGGLSAADVDLQPYSVTLQQLEMMADEAAELEKAKSKHH